jgi:ABC-2 type transport system ATP-binding protein
LPEVEAICDRVAIIRHGKIKAVETVANLTRVSFRWMTLRFAEPISLNGFSQLPGVSEATLEGTQLRMRVSGDANMDTLIKTAAQHTVVDLQYEQPSLEEIFLAYYGNSNGVEG